MSEAHIAYCAIYPGIGIARVGNSPTRFFVGPETPGLPVSPDGGFKDGQGRVKRQAARFRIYAFDENDRAIQELTSAEATIEWTVHLANKKGSWFEFLGFAREQETSQGGDPLPLRNPDIQDRPSLVIEPGPRSISGPDANGDVYRFDGGTFRGQEVALGELRTDEAGRLLVLGGFGHAGSVKKDNPITHYANNNDWFDDTSDGPVTAKVTLRNGEEIPVQQSSWVITCPPDFAPSVEDLTSLYEVAQDVGISQGWIPEPDVVSFTRDIYPILSRVAHHPWTNAVALRGHRSGSGPSSPDSQNGERVGDFLTPSRLAVLSDNRPAARAARDAVFKRLRNPAPETPDQAQEQANYFYMPPLSGDEGDATQGNPSTWFSIPPRLYEKFRRWAEGDFTPDWCGTAPTPVPFHDLPVEEQPAALDRAALEHCVGGPFFPGIEMTYIARDPSYYVGPFRLRHDLEPGDITKRMAVPWHSDSFKCRGFEGYGPWWPAQRPDDVITETDYEAVLASFQRDSEGLTDLPTDVVFPRKRWERGVGDRIHYQGEARRLVERTKSAGHNEMVEEWSQLGFIVSTEVPGSDSQVFVEKDRAPYGGLLDREYFHIMLNLENHADFLSVARALAEDFLTQARSLQADPALEDELRPFPYTEAAFHARLDQIYYGLVDYVDAYSPATDRRFKTRDDLIEYIRQFAPFNQTDGVWLRNVVKIGPIDEVHSLLFSIWMDEVGDGNPRLSHANLYTDLLHSVGIYPFDVSSRAYAEDSAVLNSAFTLPLFQLVVSEFSENFFPEILGMTLYLEWEVLSLKATIALFEYHDLNPDFYRMHVGIDNAADGHGAKAKEAVRLYLDEVRSTSGEEAVQEQWKRIWDGYVAFRTTGTLGQDLVNKLENPPSLEDQVIAMITRKRPYGQFNHASKKLGPSPINDLFDVPKAFMAALIKSGQIVPGEPDISPFFNLLQFTGPMYKVFTDAEIDLWEDWTRSLTSDTQPPGDPGVMERMVRLVDAMRERQEDVKGHQVNKLAGPDPSNPDQTVIQSVGWWFQQPPRFFMQTLANEANGWIVPGDAASSRFVTELLSGDNRMAKAFSEVAPGTSHRTWRSLVIDWISAGCPIPNESFMRSLAPSRRTEDEIMALTAAGPVRRLSLWSTSEEIARHPEGRIMGMGTVH